MSPWWLLDGGRKTVVHDVCLFPCLTVCCGCGSLASVLDGRTKNDLKLELENQQEEEEAEEEGKRAREREREKVSERETGRYSTTSKGRARTSV